MKRWFKLLYWKFYLGPLLREFANEQHPLVAYPCHIMLELEAKDKYMTSSWPEFHKWLLDEFEKMGDRLKAMAGDKRAKRRFYEGLSLENRKLMRECRMLEYVADQINWKRDDEQENLEV